MAPRNEEENQMIRDERREQILQAALKVFGHKGFAAAKIGDIAATAGLSHGLVYHYFESKDQIFSELVKIALEGSAGTFKIAYEMPGTPWERIRAMTEMIVPVSYQGIGPYYFYIMMHAMTSDAVSREVKDMILKNAPYYDYLVPLIIEGQEAGQVAEGEPQQLATAYLGLIQGLAIMLLQSDDTAALPTPDIVLRLLKKDHQTAQTEVDTSSIIHHEHIRESIFQAVKLTDSMLQYRSRTNISGESVLVNSVISESVENGVRIYRMEETNDRGVKLVATIRADDWRPLAIESFDQAGRKLWQIIYRDNSVSFDIPERKLKKTIDLKGECYDNNILFYLLRAFPFGKSTEIEFDMVMDGKGGSPPGPFKMYVREIAQEKVKTAAGIFDCVKLEMGVKGVPAIFAGRYKYYFWYTADPPHYLVKYEDKQGGLRELVGIDA